MAKDRVPARQRLARNLKVLMEVRGLSNRQVAVKAGIDPKTITNMLRASFDPRLSLVEKVATALMVSIGHLLASDLEALPPDSAESLRLLEHFSSAPDSGRRAILQVAEIASHKG
jgi:transcriptional regulator with XRE-family HTH domain